MKAALEIVDTRISDRPMTEAKQAIDRLRREHQEAVNSCDVDLLLRGMADDVVYLGLGAAPVVGKTALRSMIEPVYAQATIQIDMTPMDIQFEDTTIIEWGRIRGVMRPAEDADLAPVSLKYLFVYRCETDGVWRISHDVYNDDPTG